LRDFAFGSLSECRIKRVAGFDLTTIDQKRIHPRQRVSVAIKVGKKPQVAAVDRLQFIFDLALPGG
jgi:hypothetical protein